MNRAFALLLVLVAAACSGATSKELTKTTPSKDYALTTCVVSGEDLGAMDRRVAYTYDGAEVQFCCDDCIAEFQKDPAKYMAMVRAAKK